MNIIMLDEPPQTYITTTHKGKEKLMRRFGQCNILDSDGKIVRQLCPSEYLYVVGEGKNLKFLREFTNKTPKTGS